MLDKIELDNKLFSEKIAVLSEDKLNEWYCNSCLKSLKYTVPPTWYFHDTGICRMCNKTNEVSNPHANDIIYKIVSSEYLEKEECFNAYSNLIWGNKKLNRAFPRPRKVH